MKEDNIFSDGRQAQTPPEQEALKERLYCRIKIPLKTLDLIIWALSAIILLLIVLGAMIGNGLL